MTVCVSYLPPDALATGGGLAVHIRVAPRLWAAVLVFSHTPDGSSLPVIEKLSRLL